MGDRFQVSAIDGPCPDVTLVDGLLLYSTDLGDGLPNVTIHVGVDVDTLDRGVVKTAQVGGAQQGEPACVCVCVSVCACV